MIRKATLEDWEKIVDFCHVNNKRLPSEIGVGIVDEVDGNIVGYVHVCTKTFIDPMVVSMDRHPVERIKTIHDLMTTVRGICYESGVNQVYITAEGEDFIKFLEKKFDIELFTKEQLYKARA